MREEKKQPDGAGLHREKRRASGARRTPEIKDNLTTRAGCVIEELTKYTRTGPALPTTAPVATYEMPRGSLSSRPPRSGIVTLRKDARYAVGGRRVRWSRDGSLSRCLGWDVWAHTWVVVFCHLLAGSLSLWGSEGGRLSALVGEG